MAWFTLACTKLQRQSVLDGVPAAPCLFRGLDIALHLEVSSQRASCTHLAQICTTQFTKMTSNVASFRAPAPAHVAASSCFFDRWHLVVGDSATCHLTNRGRCVGTAQRVGRQNRHLHQCDVLC